MPKICVHLRNLRICSIPVSSVAQAANRESYGTAASAVCPLMIDQPALAIPNIDPDLTRRFQELNTPFWSAAASPDAQLASVLVRGLFDPIKNRVKTSLDVVRPGCPLDNLRCRETMNVIPHYRG